MYQWLAFCKCLSSCRRQMVWCTVRECIITISLLDLPPPPFSCLPGINHHDPVVAHVYSFPFYTYTAILVTLITMHKYGMNPERASLPLCLHRKSHKQVYNHLFPHPPKNNKHVDTFLLGCRYTQCADSAKKMLRTTITPTVREELPKKNTLKPLKSFGDKPHFDCMLQRGTDFRVRIESTEMSPHALAA